MRLECADASIGLTAQLVRQPIGRGAAGSSFFKRDTSVLELDISSHLERANKRRPSKTSFHAAHRVTGPGCVRQLCPLTFCRRFGLRQIG